MSLPAPVLDDRTFQQIVDEVRKRIPLYCPEWTDHNLSDPGITLIELFAWMVEMLLYRLNRVPELHYVKFMEFLGYHRRAPTAAETRVIFWLTKPLTPETDPDHQGLQIQAGVEVATTQTETTKPIIFGSKENFAIHAPILKAVMVERITDKVPQPLSKEDVRNLADRQVTDPKGINMFSEQPQPEEAVYFGFDNFKRDLSYHILSLNLRCESKSGVGVNPDYPPYEWEAYTVKEEWEPLKKGSKETAPKASDSWGELEKDTTRALNAPGEVVLLLPELGKRKLTEQTEELHWVRVRVKKPTPEETAIGMQPYNDTPYLRQIVQFATVGALVPISNARIATKELIGESDGAPGQRFHLGGTPVLLPMADDECLRVEEDEWRERDTELWRYVDNFAKSNENSQHFTIDSLSGELRFGPAVRQPSGEIKQYGKTPPRNARLIFERYRYGGGASGNVPRRAINVLKTSIPYVDRVENRREVQGGTDGQSIEAAQLEVQRMIRTRRLAVTPDDYEARVIEQFPGKIARVRCLPLKDDPKGAVRILLMPTLSVQNRNGANGYLTNADLHVPSGIRKEVEDFLEEIRMLTAPVRIENFTYYRVRVVVQLSLRTNARKEEVENAARQRLNTLLHPLRGGMNENGWPFDAALTAADVQRWLEKLPGVQAVDQVELQEAEDVGAQKTAESEQRTTPRGNRIELAPDAMFVSGHHQVNFSK